MHDALSQNKHTLRRQYLEGWCWNWISGNLIKIITNSLRDYKMKQVNISQDVIILYS